jgi:hypothetical protein
MVWVARAVDDHINFLMDCYDGCIYGYDLDFPDDIGLVATAFPMFFRGIATCYICAGDTRESNEKLNKFIKQAVGSTWDGFW